MYSIRKQFTKFYTTCEFGTFLFKSLDHDAKSKFIFASGVLNYLWQIWGQFWRTLWLTYLLGGENLWKIRIHPYFQNKTENEAIYFILFLLGRRSNPVGSIGGSHQEPTWGDKDVIEKIAFEIVNQSVSGIGTNVLNAFNALGDTPKHFQIVRNASIHLNIQGYQNVRSILPYYVLSSFDYPTEILFCHELRSGKLAYKHWVEDLVAVIDLIFA